MKESVGGLTEITMDAKARAKWIYTKPLCHPSCQKSGESSAGWECETMINQACIKQHMINAFAVDSSNMLNSATGQAATETIKKVLEIVEQIAQTELQKCFNNNSKKVQKVNLHTFEALHSIPHHTAPLK